MAVTTAGKLAVARPRIERSERINGWLFVMPALGFTIWGPNVILQTIAEDDPYAPKVRTSNNPYAAEFHGRELMPLHEPEGVP